MIEPTENDIGRWVIYTGNRGWKGPDEAGVITSFNQHTVFVRYGSDKGSKGTSRADLEWEHHPSMNDPDDTEGRKLYRAQANALAKAQINIARRAARITQDDGE